MFADEDSHFFEFRLDLGKAIAAEMISPFGILITGEIDLALLHFQGRSPVDEVDGNFGPGRHLEGVLFREEDGWVGAVRSDIHGSIICIFELHFFFVRFAQLDLE